MPKFLVDFELTGHIEYHGIIPKERKFRYVTF